MILDNKGHTERCELYIHAKIDPVANRFVNVAVNSIDVMGLFKNNNGQ